MRLPFLAALLLAACAADPVLLPDAGPCSSACGAGTVCSGGACVAVDAGSDAGTVDVGGAEDRPQPVDLGAEDAGTDAGAMDAETDAGAADVDPRQSETCRAVNATCAGRRVNVQTGERDGGAGQTFFCGNCETTCGAGFVCNACVCER